MLLIYSVSVVMMFMKSLDSFKNFMFSNDVPNYVKRYCSGLDEFKWQWFYYQMKEPVKFVADIEYLVYILKWILKEDFDDLGYAVYFQVIMDPEIRPEPLIKDEWRTILDKRYQERLQNDLTVWNDKLDDPAAMHAVDNGAVIIF